MTASRLRTTNGASSELLAYDREDTTAARASDYGLCPIDHAALMDDVFCLGCFVELETVINAQSDDEAAVEHDEVITTLGLGGAERIAVGYVDLSKESTA